jgi:quinone-modifying oxidoreductase subunit QmoC
VPTLLCPDRAFLARLLADGGEDLKRCFQCATCAVTCDLSPTDRPFPRKELLWAQWGLSDRLVSDPDIWLCHQCQDCTARCPRGARPGDVMAALRRESVRFHARPRALARWLERPRSLGILFAAALALPALAALWVAASGVVPARTESFAFATWSWLPRGVLIGLYGALAGWVVVAAGLGVMGLWRGFGVPGPTVKGAAASLAGALRRIVAHQDFSRCEASRSRRIAHQAVLFGAVGLVVVDAWVLLGRFNPVLQALVYPWSFWNPWKIMANVAGLAVLVGCGLMARDRLRCPGDAQPGTRADWIFLGLLAAAVLTGFGIELAHLARFTLKGVVYLAHLGTVAVLLLSLPYSRLAHALYRTTALVWAERYGRLPPEGGRHA